MKFLVILAAVVLLCQAAKVPQEVTHQVTVPVPNNVLAAPPTASQSSSEVPSKAENAAQVVQVTKDYAHAIDQMATVKPVVKSMATDMPNKTPVIKSDVTVVQAQTKTLVPDKPEMPPMTEIKHKTQAVSEEDDQMKQKEQPDMTPMKPEVKTMTPEMVLVPDMQRKTRAVPFIDGERIKPQLATDINVIRGILAQRKSSMVTKIPLHRSKRSEAVETTTEIPVTIKPEDIATLKPLSVKPVVKSVESATISSINPCDLLCTKFEFYPICATNGLCLHEFPNQCILDTYNCKHPKLKFSATKDDRCQMHWLTKCDESEMI